MMTTLHRGEKENVSYTKGSPDEILERSAFLLEGGGRIPMTPEKRREIDQVIHAFTGEALRVLALGMRNPASGLKENGLTFIGFVGMADPIRPEAEDAVQEFYRAGVKTVMITGDRIDTAFAIAKELHIASEENECISGEELMEMTDEMLAEKIKRCVYLHMSHRSTKCVSWRHARKTERLLR